MRYSYNKRQQKIIDILIEKKEVRIPFLSDKFKVTEMTIRRDLEKLEQSGFSRRIFGGAILVNRDIALPERIGVMKEEKLRIGSEAANLVLPGESIFIDAGTTTVQIVPYLKPEYGITVVTNGLNVAEALQYKGISTIVTGGNLMDTTFSLVGPIAIDALSQMAYDRAFIGTTGLTKEHGFSNSNMQEAEIKKLAIQQASEVNILLDHTKFEQKGLVSFANLDHVQRIISDENPANDLVEACNKQGVEILVC